jgi:hypothetical protein
MFSQFLIKPSRTFGLILFSVHLLAIFSVLLTNLARMAQLSLALLISLSLLHHLYRHILLRSKHSWCAFSLDQKHLLIHTRGGIELAGFVAANTLVTPLCVMLCASLDGHKLPVCQVIFPDAMHADAFRELCVRLKFS